MTDQELEALEQIWKGKTNWGPEWEKAMDDLAAEGYIEIIEKHTESQTGQGTIDLILVEITDEGIGHLSGSAY